MIILIANEDNQIWVIWCDLPRLLDEDHEEVSRQDRERWNKREKRKSRVIVDAPAAAWFALPCRGQQWPEGLWWIGIREILSLIPIAWHTFPLCLPCLITMVTAVNRLTNLSSRVTLDFFLLAVTSTLTREFKGDKIIRLSSLIVQISGFQLVHARSCNGLSLSLSLCFCSLCLRRSDPANLPAWHTFPFLSLSLFWKDWFVWDWMSTARKPSLCIQVEEK